MTTRHFDTCTSCNLVTKQICQVVRKDGLTFFFRRRKQTFGLPWARRLAHPQHARRIVHTCLLASWTTITSLGPLALPASDPRLTPLLIGRAAGLLVFFAAITFIFLPFRWIIVFLQPDISIGRYDFARVAAGASGGRVRREVRQPTT